MRLDPRFEVDILVVGGGPAGLLSASQLSARHSVALIEKGNLGETTKFWVTTERRLAKHGLSGCVLHRTDRMIAGTFLGGEVSAVGDFAIVDDRKALRLLLDRCNERGVHLVENCRLVNFRQTDDGRLLAETTRGTFSTRIIADASGGSSPIASTFKLHRLDGFYSVYGCHLEEIAVHTEAIVLGYVNELGSPPPIFEVIPTGRGSAYCVLFICAKTLVTPQTLQNAFERHCDHNPFFSMTSRSRRGPEKAGAIPIGRLRRRSLPGVIPLGEAAMIQPPLMGTAFNEVLEHSEAICREISLALSRADRPPRAPRLYPLLKRLQDRFQRPVARILIEGNVEELDRVLRAMQEFSPQENFAFFSSELTLPQFLRLAIRMSFKLLLSGRRRL